MDANQLVKKIKMQQDLDLQGCADLHKLLSIISAKDEELEAVKAERDESRSRFKAFHASFCRRFAYSHDEVDWSRDLISLEEHIARELAERDALIAELQRLCERAYATFDGVWDKIASDYGPTSLMRDLEKAKNGKQLRDINTLNEELGKALRKSLEQLADANALIEKMRKEEIVGWGVWNIKELKLEFTGDTKDQAEQFKSFCGDGRYVVPIYLAPTLPEGWKAVPVEPTDEMRRLANNAIRQCYPDVKDVWDAMLEAAPELPK